MTPIAFFWSRLGGGVATQAIACENKDAQRRRIERITMLIVCIAAIPCSAGSLPTLVLTLFEKAKRSPAINPHPMAQTNAEDVSGDSDPLLSYRNSLVHQRLAFRRYARRLLLSHWIAPPQDSSGQPEESPRIAPESQYESFGAVANTRVRQ